MRGFVLFLTVSAALSAQSMVEMGAVTAGATVGGVAGKSVSNSITNTFRKTGTVVDKASKFEVKPPVPTVQASPGAPKAAAPERRTSNKNLIQVAEPNNVPPPPPPARREARQPARPAAVPVAYVEPVPVPEPAPRLEVDLNTVQTGMPRTDLLALGAPSARITMFEDGHLVEIYNYRNTTLASGDIRLIDGAVATVRTRP